MVSCEPIGHALSNVLMPYEMYYFVHFGVVNQVF